ncbi:MAG: EutN/CcmL family microcompartment protein [Chloroflexi bacterium]|nr:EutN/CcmL family microcompartment protein [Chloroflexota bacterium]MBI3740316.1 EutN/CcmL family microcompartment protein [Chloroflexota bacterium]
MILGRVVGEVIATIKDESLAGQKLLLTQLLNAQREPIGRPQVAIETVDAGIGDFVFLVRAREASLATFPIVGPVDLAIIGVVDHADALDHVELELPFGYSQFT